VGSAADHDREHDHESAEWREPGRPVPGGGAIAFVARLSSQDFGSSAARIAPSGIIRAAE
jgi:hypothetical protein